MAHPLDGVWLKVVRADEHLKAIRVAVAEFLGSNPYSARREFDAKRREYVYYAQVHHRPTGIGVLVGDFAHNVRSAFDHIAWQLACLGAGPPDDRTQFPIYDKLSDWSIRRREIRSILPAARDGYIESLQPYHGLTTIDDRPRYLLRLLRDLSNTDKHRSILLIGSQVWPRGFEPMVTDGGEPWLLQWNPGPFDDGHPFARIPATADGDEQFKPEFVFDVSLGEKGPAYGTPLIDLLGDMHNCARWELMPELAGFFPQPDNPFHRS